MIHLVLAQLSIDIPENQESELVHLRICFPLKIYLQAYNVDGLPSETDDEIAEKILDFVIGEER